MWSLAIETGNQPGRIEHEHGDDDEYHQHPPYNFHLFSHFFVVHHIGFLIIYRTYANGAFLRCHRPSNARRNYSTPRIFAPLFLRNGIPFGHFPAALETVTKGLAPLGGLGAQLSLHSFA